MKKLMFLLILVVGLLSATVGDAAKLDFTSGKDDAMNAGDSHNKQSANNILAGNGQQADAFCPVLFGEPCWF